MYIRAQNKTYQLVRLVFVQKLNLYSLNAYTNNCMQLCKAKEKHNF